MGRFRSFHGLYRAGELVLTSELAPLFAWSATIAELILGVLLILGLWLVYVAVATGVFLALFAVAMTISFGIKEPLAYSMFAVSSAGFVLALLGMSTRK